MGNMLQGAITAVIGIVIVLIVLCVISLILSIFSLLFYKSKNISSKNNETAEKAAPVKERTAIRQKIANKKANKRKSDDTEIVAVITAAIAASMNTTTDKLIVRSIHKVSSWNETAISQNQSKLF